MDFLANSRRKTAWVFFLAVVVGGVGLAIALWGERLGLMCGVPCMALVMLTLYSRNTVAPMVAGVVAFVVAGICFLRQGNAPEMALTLSGVALGVGFGVRRIRSYARTRRRAQFSQSIVDALTSQVAVLDSVGSVAAMNEAWRRMAGADESPLRGCGLGSNFLELAPKVACAGDGATQCGVAEGIRALLASGAAPAFEAEYAFGHASKRWFVLRITRFEESRAVWAVVEQEEITARKLAELEVEQSRAVYRELATRDELTGLYNRRALDQLLTEEVGRYERYGNHVAMAMADIDHFKRVNDEHGHVVGDAALKWLADLLAKNVRVVDKVARYGGEEFAIIAPELSAAEACGMAERLRGMIVSHPFRYTQPDGTTLQLPITVSFGVAAIPSDVERGSDLVLAADKALYAAKRCGRNCTVQFRELEEPLVS